MGLTELRRVPICPLADSEYLIRYDATLPLATGTPVVVIRRCTEVRDRLAEVDHDDRAGTRAEGAPGANQRMIW